MSHYKSIAIFVLPMSYAFATRYKGITGISAWVIKYLLPVMFLSCGLEGFDAARFILGLLYLYSLYEIGYIQNDCETIKKETNPTLRITEEQLVAYESHKKVIYLLRFVQIALWGEVLLLLCESNVRLLLYGLVTLPVFLWYNHVRSGFSLVIHLLLMMLRYTVPVFLATNSGSAEATVFLLFAYPITLFIERSVKGKFGYRNHFFSKWLMHDYSCRYAFRLKYYAIILVVTAVTVWRALLPYTCVVPIALLLFTSLLNVRSKRMRYDK